MKNKALIDKVKRIFILYYGAEYKDLIEERMSSLFDIVFYDRKSNVLSFDKIDESFLNYYGIDSHHEEIIEGKVPFNSDLIKNGYQGTMPYIDNNVLKTIIYFPRTIDKQYNYDCVLIHELLHILDEHIIINKTDLIVSRGGFEDMTLKGDYEIKRQYEYLNEIIHQTIAEDITIFAHQQNIFLFNDNLESLKSRDYYDSDQDVVINYLFKSFKDKLVVDKFIGNIDSFILHVGKENFENLNRWIKKYYNTYPTKDKRLDSISNIDYYSFINEGLNIIEVMKDNNKIK